MNPVEKSVIDNDVRFSESKMWSMQRSFYEVFGLKCWQECVVPNFVTSNCFIAYAYARSILAFARDYYSMSYSDSCSQPLYIIEIGAGAAKLSYVLLHKLIGLKAYWPKRKDGKLPFKYVITDSTSASFGFFRNHSCLKPLFESGLLDLACYDAENDHSMTLEISNEVLRPDSLDNPVVLVANYVFDSLRQDAFRVTSTGALEELLCTVLAVTAPIELLLSKGPEILKYVRCSWRAKPVKDVYLYYEDDEDIAGVLEEMRCECEQRHIMKTQDFGEEANISDGPKPQVPGRSGEGSGSSFLMPIGAMASLRNIRRLAKNGRMVVLAGDKGHTQLAELDGHRDPHVAMHGSFSCMVNFLALKLFVENTGGFVLSSPSMEGFKCVAYGFGLGENPVATAGFRMQFGQTLGGRFGPDGFSTLQRCLKEESKTPGLRSALAVVRLSQHDPDVLYKFKQVFIDKVPHASDKLQNDIRHDMQLVYACYYPLLPSKDVSFEIGRIYMGLKDFEIAVGFFKASQLHCGVHHVSWYNMGVCHYYLNELDSAATCFDESLALCADYPDAMKWRRKVDHLREFLGDEPQRVHLPRDESVNANSGAGLTPRIAPNMTNRISSRRI